MTKNLPRQPSHVANVCLIPVDEVAQSVDDIKIIPFVSLCKASVKAFKKGLGWDDIIALQSGKNWKELSIYAKFVSQDRPQILNSIKSLEIQFPRAEDANLGRALVNQKVSVIAQNTKGMVLFSQSHTSIDLVQLWYKDQVVTVPKLIPKIDS